MADPAPVTHSGDRKRLVDLFCKAGGASVGYARAGWEVVGVDRDPQPNYPFPFFQADALTFPLDGFDAVHASPPCQRWTSGQPLQGREHPDLITPLRPILAASGLPWVMENVPRAPLRHDLVLCGSMFGLEGPAGVLYRHRVFEVGGWALGPWTPATCRHDRPAISIFGHNVQLWNGGNRIHLGYAYGKRLMGVEWMAWDEMNEAIPPAYTEWIGKRLLAQLSEAAA